ncbi:MAG: hypothetical protein IPN65_03960 [Elusimicrobia bacterium]|nr:hypothetical protein [Elusimicrobiota bacterium]MBK9429643.1 hypothetical protein [Elusimicrobiota bacterium]
MTDKSEGPTNPYGHEDCDDICGCGDKCKISAWDNGYAAGFKAGLDEEIAKVERLRFVLKELHALVWGEAPSLLCEDSGGDALLDCKILEVLEP